MSYDSLLTDRCNIFHLVETAEATTYGVPGESEYSYSNQADLIDVPCLFGKESNRTFKNDPGVQIVQSYLVHFFIGTDVRFNDKVIFNGTTYRLEVPRNMRGHHIEVRAVRDDWI